MLAAPTTPALSGRVAVIVVLGFALLTVAATWPLAAHLGRSLPSDLGDPLFVTWVMAWVARHLTAAARGDVGALARMWDAPIFAPESGTLAYSEHFTGQALLALPVYWLGGTPIAAYNVAFLLSFLLSALGAFALVRVLTGHTPAAAAAGVLYGFNVYRAYSLAHLHTLTAQWVPLALAALVLFARRGSPVSAAGTAAALVMTAWSGLYYMAYFAPVVALAGTWTLLEHDGWRHRRAVVALAVAATVAGAIVVPFLLPYVSAQQALGIVRPRREIEMYSLTIDGYLAARWYLAPTIAAAVTPFIWWPAAPALRRATAVFAVVALLGFWLSLGPTPRWDGQTFGVPGLYALLLGVPGFTGLRVASRFGMVLMLGLSVLGGLGIASIGARHRRLATAIALAAIAWQAGAYLSIPKAAMDTPLATGVLRPVPAYLDPPVTAPIYDTVRRLDPTAVVAELPFGEPAYELRYMAAGITHGRRLVNGYSGVFPPSYRARVPALSAPWRDPAGAWRALAPATHVVVHTEAWPHDEGTRVEQWLEAGGARLLSRWTSASVWQLPPRR